MNNKAQVFSKTGTFKMGDTVSVYRVDVFKDKGDMSSSSSTTARVWNRNGLASRSPSFSERKLNGRRRVDR